jgi:hypothetical protein
MRIRLNIELSLKKKAAASDLPFLNGETWEEDNLCELSEAVASDARRNDQITWISQSRLKAWPLDLAGLRAFEEPTYR